MCPSGATCLTENCCLGELASTIINPTKCVGLVQSGPHHHLTETCSCHDIAEKLLSWR